MDTQHEEIKRELAEMRSILEATYASAEKTRKYFLWTMVAAIVTFILPLVGVMLVAPSVIGGYTSSLESIQ